MAAKKSDVLQGTLALLILRTLRLEPMHGFGIAQRIQQMSGEVFQINQGSLYPALHRLEEEGWIASHWASSDNNRRAKYYTLTANGRRQLGEEEREWSRLVTAISRVLESA